MLVGNSAWKRKRAGVDELEDPRKSVGVESTYLAPFAQIRRSTSFRYSRL